jgi:hypothetical protein
MNTIKRAAKWVWDKIVKLLGGGGGPPPIKPD